MTQTGIHDFESDGNTAGENPPKPALKITDDGGSDETIAVVQAWSETTFRREARRTLEAMTYINDNPGDVIDELVDGQSPVELEVPGPHRAEIHGLCESIGLGTAAIDAAINSDAAETTVLTPALTHVGRDIEEIREQLIKLLNAGVSIDTPQGSISPDCREAVDAILTGIDDAGDRLITGADATDLVNDAESYTGRPPIGFEVNNGQLQKSDDYTAVRAALKAVIADDMSKAAAGREIGCASKTVTRAIDEHPERYQL